VWGLSIRWAYFIARLHEVTQSEECCLHELRTITHIYPNPETTIGRLWLTPHLFLQLVIWNPVGCAQSNRI
jgi:hypothetical protein